MDRGYALAWMRNKAETCSCGTRQDEWDEDREAYVPDVHYCRGHDLLAQHARSDQMPKNPDGSPLPGFLPFLMPRERYEALHEGDEPTDN